MINSHVKSSVAAPSGSLGIDYGRREQCKSAGAPIDVSLSRVERVARSLRPVGRMGSRHGNPQPRHHSSPRC